MNDLEKLIAEADAVRLQAYAPYSNFKVGAALLSGQGEIYTGCNVENASYGLTTCAERVAVVKAVAAGEREFTAVALVTDTPQPTAPCGACCQILAEFNPDMQIIMGNLGGKRAVFNLRQLLPSAFNLKGAGDS